MTEKEFFDLVSSGSEKNKILENKVRKQGFVYYKKGKKIEKLSLMSITMFPYGDFTCGLWNGKQYVFVIVLKWEDYKKTWFLSDNLDKEKEVE